LVKQLDGLWLIFLNQYLFGHKRQASKQASKQASNQAFFHSCTANSIIMVGLAKARLK